MNSFQEKNTMPAESAELITILNELLERSNGLRTALMKRDINAIWTASGTQEELLYRLQSLENQKPAIPYHGPAAKKAYVEHQKTVGTLVNRIKTIQRTNKMMASAFLAIINRTFSSLCAGGNNAAGTYSSTGNRDVTISSILVEQQG
jgi:hypothetical protein